MSAEFVIKFPFSALVFDFDHEGEGVAWVVDKFGHSAKLRLSVTYPYTEDPTFWNLWIEKARLTKGMSTFEISPRQIKIVQEVKASERSDD